MLLDTVNKKIQARLVEAAVSVNPVFTTTYADITSAAFTPAAGEGSFNGTTAIDLVTAPAASTQRHIKEIQINNTDTVDHSFTVWVLDSVTSYIIVSSILVPAGQALRYSDATGWAVGLSGISLVSAPGTFSKADPNSVGFTKTGAGTVSIKAGTKIDLAGVLYSFTTDTAVQMPALAAGTDYAIYIVNDGTVRADANFSAPLGFTTATSRKIGGFHYAPGGNATAQAGGDTVPAINPYSIWDLKWRPACPDPRGMALIGGGFWCDIYLCNTAPETNGTSGYNLTIADGASPPKIPTAFGGDGIAAYVGFNWWEASEVMSAAGKQLLSYLEFAAAMYGSTEAASFGTDPGSTILRNAYTSKWGIMLATGNMLVWGRDLNYYLAGGAIATDEAFSWHNNAGGRGQFFSQGTFGLSAALFGGSWSNGANAGSRASEWDNYPWASGGTIGARGRCDHMRLA